jgi:septal ring factor EnvC (AmiA/AmiB activator)
MTQRVACDKTRTELATTMMKHKTLLLTFLSIAAFTVGCDKTETTSQKLDKVQEKTAEAAQDMKDYTFAQKAEFTEKMRSQLAEINKDLDQLDAKIDESSDAVKTEAKLRLRVLRDQTAQLNKQLEGVKNATEPTWNDAKAGFKKGYGELKVGFQAARQWVSDKIAP